MDSYELREIAQGVIWGNRCNTHDATVLQDHGITVLQYYNATIHTMLQELEGGGNCSGGNMGKYMRYTRCHSITML